MKNDKSEIATIIRAIIAAIAIGAAGVGVTQTVKFVLIENFNLTIGNIVMDSSVGKEKATSKKTVKEGDLHVTIEAIGDAYISEADIDCLYETGGFTAVRTLRNYPYAKHGYAFDNGPLRRFYDGYSWYAAVYDNEFDASSQFSAKECKNVETIVSWERKNGSPYH